ncbi:MAG TPA: glycoside hydrolase family 19 protein, partial [Gemmataceae bacterium]|nr:glycoside hydrolase family 19 protein [Gemmataceae bacterium]
MRMMIVAAAAVGMAAAAGAEELANPGGGPALPATKLREIMPKLDAGRAESFQKPLADAMKEFGINTPKRRAAFLAQVAQESHELKHFEELVSSVNGYAPGNTNPHDTTTFRARGPLMMAGKANYKAAGQALKLDLEHNPDLVLKTEVGFRVAAWYWKTMGLNELADHGDIRGI